MSLKTSLGVAVSNVSDFGAMMDMLTTNKMKFSYININMELQDTMYVSV
jgi:hypothetical protein